MGKAIGIDFGTSNTVVTFLDKRDRFRQLKINNKALIPTELHFQSQGEYLIGEEARNKNKSYNGAGTRAFKSKLGEKFCRVDIQPANGERPFRLTPKLAVKLFINKLVQAIEKQLIKEFGADEGVLDKMVLTIPVKFNRVEKEAIRQAAMAAISSADPESVKLVPEPTAAAIAAMDEDAEDLDTILVYDFGGGTFDVSLIRKERGVYKQIDSDGDKHLGGNDLSTKLAQNFLDQLNDYFGTEIPWDEDQFDEDYHDLSLQEYKDNIYALWETANSFKEDLSEYDETGLDINVSVSRGKNEYKDLNIDRDELEALLKDDIERTIEITSRMVEKYKDDFKIDKLVLAGGSSRIPMIRRLLEERLPDIPISSNLNVSTLISRGAAILAQRMDEINNLTSQKTVMRIGTCASEGVRFNKFQPILRENQNLPCEGSQEFSLAQDGQETLQIHYYEHDVYKNPDAVYVSDDGIQEVDCVSVALPPNLQKDETKIVLTFRMEQDGSLKISAQVKDLDDRLMHNEDLVITMQSELE